MTVLCYHAINPTWPSPVSVHPVSFAAQCRWLAAHRTVMPLEAAVEQISPRGLLPRGRAALTFDDGFASVHEHAWPILRRHRLPATVFLVAQTLSGAGQEVDWIDTPPPHESRTLSTDQVREMQDAGVTFQSHSWCHADLTQLSHAECVTDLRDSRELLESVLDRRVSMLAYPRGRHAPHVRAAAQAAGYSQAFTLPEGPEQVGAYALPRVGIYRRNDLRALRVKATRPYLAVRTSGTVRSVRRTASALTGRRS